MGSNTGGPNTYLGPQSAVTEAKHYAAYGYRCVLACGAGMRYFVPCCSVSTFVEGAAGFCVCVCVGGGGGAPPKNTPPLYFSVLIFPHLYGG